MGVRVGTSGYSYQDWKGAFYPGGMPARAFLAHYAGEFDVVEVNATYYRLPSLKSLQGMVARTPPGFTFVIKAHHALTHAWGEEAERTLPMFQRALEPFRDAGKLGAVLLQFPFAFQPSPEAAAYVDHLADALAASTPVVEFRHRGWFAPERLDWLRARKLSLCCVDEPALPNLPPPLALVTGPAGYVRFHGRNQESWWGGAAEGDPGARSGSSEPSRAVNIVSSAERAAARYNYLYDEKELAEWVPKVRAMARETESIYVFFNNHPGGKAVRNARQFRNLLAGAD